MSRLLAAEAESLFNAVFHSSGVSLAILMTSMSMASESQILVVED